MSIKHWQRAVLALFVFFSIGANYKGVSPSADLGGHLFDENGVVQEVQRAFVDVTDIGDTELVPPQGAENKLRVLALFLKTGAAVTVRLKSGGANNITAALALSTDGFVLGYNSHGWMQTNVNEALVLNQSLVVATAVHIVWLVTQ